MTIYSSFDAGFCDQTAQSTGGNSRVTMGSTGTYNSNRIGFKGVEDLGGGPNAHFTLKSGFNSGTGANTDTRFFNRFAFVGLGGNWGSLDLGRQYTVAFKTVGAYDPFNYKFTGIIPTSQASISAGTRNDNDIQYIGTFGPLTARAEYALGEQVGGGSNDSVATVGATFTTGPFSVGAAYTKRRPTVGAVFAVAAVAAVTSTNVAGFVTSTIPVAGQNQDNTHFTVGGAVTCDPTRIAAGNAREKQDRAAAIGGDASQKNAGLGGSYDITPALGLTAAYYDTKGEGFGSAGTSNGKRQLFIIGATHALSKRTNFYADVDYACFKGDLFMALTQPCGGQSKQTGVSVGINHLF